MKCIAKELLIDIIEKSDKSIYDEQELIKIISLYGNEWFIVDGEWKQID